jgi:hypothetical protein
MQVNMKKQSILFLVLAVSLQYACNKSLEPKVYSSLTNANAFQTESDAIAAVNAVYARLKGPSVGDNYTYWTVRHFALTDLTTDIGHCSLGGDPGQLSLAQWSPANGLIGEGWQYPYKLVSDANNAIYNLSPMTGITEAQKAQFLSEIKFCRAVAYYDLTDAFGPVVLATEKDIASPDYNSQPKTVPVATIDSLIITDLGAAATVLPVNYVSNAIYSTNDVGRATKGAALTLLMKLYMRERNWQKVADLTQQIMGLNTYTLYPSYLGLFTEANKWCSENIFSVLCDANTNGSELMNHFGPLNHPVVQNRWQYYAVSWDFWNGFDNADDRKWCFYPSYTGVDNLKYMQGPTLTSVAPPGFSYMADIATKKYADSLGSVLSYYDGHSVDILRYADVLLSRAEALNELSGPSTENIGLINQVKGRSHAKLLDMANYTQSTLRDAILQERGWEFFYEGKRREDLIRMNKYDVLVNAYLTRIGQPAVVTMPKDQYFPYPLSQVTLNPNLDNSGRQ